MTSLAALLERSQTLRPVRAALAADRPWLVGGSVRDLLMERPVDDIDLVVEDDAEGTARRLADATSGHVFPLSEEFGAWRAIAPDRSWQVDVTPVRGGSLEADLALRDFTVNAIATPLRSGDPVIDPHGGLADLDARLLRVIGERSYADDALRTLRMARLACELDLDVEERTRALARRHAPDISAVAPERVFYELRRLVAADGVLRGIDLMDGAGLVAQVLPELEEQKGVEQNPYHHLDVWGHTLAVLESLLELERNPRTALGQAAEPVVGELQRPLADELTRGEALRFGALLHDVGKPRTRQVVGGRVLFLGHDELGAEMSRAICERLRTSATLADYVAALARHHLRLGFLVHERPLTRRHVYRYLRSCEPVEVEVTALSVADRLATRGERTRDEAVNDHLELAAELAAEAVQWRRGAKPEPPVRGDELMRELGIEPGPKVGELLELLREAAFAGEVTSPGEAIELARRELGRQG